MEAEAKRKFLLQYRHHLDEIDSGRCAFDGIDGTHYEGYILEIGYETFEFYHGGPMGGDHPVYLRIADLDTSTFFYYDKVRKCWCRYPDGEPDQRPEKNK